MDKNKIILIIFCISFTLFIFLLSYKLVLSLTPVTADQQQTINFLQHKEELNLNYTTVEISHLEDVKLVMKNANYFFYFSLLICTLILTYYKRNKSHLVKLLFYGGLTTIILTLLSSILALLSFNFTFTLFHQLFFPQGNWLFSVESLLIQIFPLDFFIRISIYIIVTTLLLDASLIILTYLTKKRLIAKK